jgi:hypothetical protein
MKEFFWLIGMIVILGILWALGGGASRTENIDKPFLEAPQPIEGGRPYTLEELKERTRP